MKERILGTPRRFARCLSLSIAVGLCMVAPLVSALFPASTPAVLEASLFNGGRSYEAEAAEETQAVSARIAGETPTQVVPMGEVFGIKLFTDGVIVASLSEIYTADGLRCPAAEAGIHPGDYLLEAEGRTIGSNADLAGVIGGSEGNTVHLKVRRGDREFETDVVPVFGDGSFKTGMWIRDSAAGIGTLTFYDPATGKFAGLGHGICDMDLSVVMRLKSGEPAPITLSGIDRSQAEDPGQLKGYFASDNSLGTLLANNETGVYGLLEEAPVGELIDILPKDQVKSGPVEIIATVDESGAKRYSAEIVRVGSTEQRTKNLVIHITDQRLLEQTGGIVQGMSGCPILQDGKLAGAVTHVFTGDAAMGYGIFAQTMAEEMGAVSAGY